MERKKRILETDRENRAVNVKLMMAMAVNRMAAGQMNRKT